MTESLRSERTRRLRDQAQALGFRMAGAVPAAPATGFSQLQQWLADGFAGEMRFIENRLDAYAHPKHVMGGVVSLVPLTLTYGGRTAHCTEPGTGRVSRYAWGNVDYHTQIHEKLRALIDCLNEWIPGLHARGVVDTAPLLEREFAQLAGLGWIGKHTLLLNRGEGSWFFLAVLLLNVELEYSHPTASDHCGACTACLDACPTQAFPRPYVLDATRCVSYLTIEHRSAIPRQLRSGIGDWVFGCDVCQDVCPWNHKSAEPTAASFAPRADLNPAAIRAWFTWDEIRFRAEFRGTPLWRARRRGLLRNAAIVLGNQPHPDSVPALIQGLQDDEELVRGAAAWSLGQHKAYPTAESALRARRSSESSEEVREEIELALSAGT